MYYHFESKEQILAALCKPCVEALHAIAPRPNEDPAQSVLEQLIDVFATRGPAIRAVMDDQSARHFVRTHTDAMSALTRLVGLLAGSDRYGDVLRAHCALGAVQRGTAAANGIRDAARNDPGARITLDPPTRKVILTAALAALRSGDGSEPET